LSKLEKCQKILPELKNDKSSVERKAYTADDITGSKSKEPKIIKNNRLAIA